MVPIEVATASATDPGDERIDGGKFEDWKFCSKLPQSYSITAPAKEYSIVINIYHTR